MEKLKQREPYTLGEIVTIIAEAIIANGKRVLYYKDRNFCLFSKKYCELATAGCIFYADEPPDIND